jgi:hypothetical protein
MATAAFALEPLIPLKPQTYNQYPGNTTRMSSRPNKRKNVLFKLGRDTTSSPATTQPCIQSAWMTINHGAARDLPPKPRSSNRTMSLGCGERRDLASTMASSGP